MENNFDLLPCTGLILLLFVFLSSKQGLQILLRFGEGNLARSLLLTEQMQGLQRLFSHHDCIAFSTVRPPETKIFGKEQA